MYWTLNQVLLKKKIFGVSNLTTRGRHTVTWRMDPPLTVQHPHRPALLKVRLPIAHRAHVYQNILNCHLDVWTWVIVFNFAFLSSPLPSTSTSNMFQCVLRSEAATWRVVTRVRSPGDIWPLAGCSADPGGWSSTMGGTCLGPVTMVTEDLLEQYRGGGLGSELGLYPDRC